MRAFPLAEATLVAPTGSEVAPSADAGATLSDDRAESVTNPPAAEEASPPSQEAGSETAAPSTPEVERTPLEDLRDLQARFDAYKADPEKNEPLTSAELGRMGRHIQSLEDQQRATAQARQQAQVKLQQVNATVGELAPRIFDRTLKLFGVDPDPENPTQALLARDIKDQIDAAIGSTEDYHLMRWDSAFKAAIYDAKGKDAKALAAVQALEGKPFVETVNAWRQAVYEAGQRDAPDSKKLATVTKERDDLKAEVLKLSGKSATGSGSTNGRSATNNIAEPATLEEARAMHAGLDPRRKLTNDEMRTYRARFTRS